MRSSTNPNLLDEYEIKTIKKIIKETKEIDAKNSDKSKEQSYTKIYHEIYTFMNQMKDYKTRTYRIIEQLYKLFDKHKCLKFYYSNKVTKLEDVDFSGSLEKFEKVINIKDCEINELLNILTQLTFME